MTFGDLIRVMCDCLVVGGGIIGWAISDELARAGRKVVLVDRWPFSGPEHDSSGIRIGAQSASYAAAGILPPPVVNKKHDPLEQLRSFSDSLFPEWATRLQADTGMDVDYDPCGGLHLARSSGELISLQAAVCDWKSDGVDVEAVSLDSLSSLEQHVDFSKVIGAYRVSGEQRVRSRSLLCALRDRATANGVERIKAASVRLELDADRVVAIIDNQPQRARELIVAAGPWSTGLLLPLGFDVGVEPRRGQIVMWQVEPNLIRHVINEGPRYVLCRADGELIVGSTVEESEFDCETTEEGIQLLIRFGEQLVPRLRGKTPDATWAGLRPHSRDGLPSIGRVDAIENLTIAIGHFRSGIHLAPATATLVRQIIIDGESTLDLSPFAARRN